MTLGAAAFPSHADPFRFWARIAPRRIALVDRTRDRRYDYAALDAAADRWAALLRSAGVGRGDQVAAISGNRMELVVLLYACMRAGAALVPLNWRLAAPELAPILADARPALLLGEERYRAVAESALADAARTAPALARLHWIDIDSEAPALLARAGDAPAVSPRTADDAALVLYTSGSTGRPKGVVLPHRQLLHNAEATSVGWELGAGDVGPLCTPLFHTGGWNVFATPLWHRGGKVVMFEQFDAAGYLDALAEEECTVAFGVPTQLVMMRDASSWGRELPRLRFMISGGAPCPSGLVAAVREAGYRFRQGYGLTECGPNCFATSDEAALEDAASVGWPVPFLEARLAATDERDAEPGEPGELLLRGPQMFAGYLGDAERTAEALAPGGWLRTGDLARRDARGAFTICGRRKEMYISGGENVFPGEVEAALADHPGVAEVVVIGVADPRWGEVGRAFVVCRSGCAPNEAEIVAFARARLAGYKVPRSVVFRSELPRLGSGKPDRRRLSDLSS